MPPTKLFEVVDVWQEVAQNSFLTGNVIDLSPNFDSLLFIDLAIISDVAHLGTKIIVLLSSHSAGDEFWSQLPPFISLIGTANEQTLNGDHGSGVSTILLASTTGYTIDGNWRFIKDNVAIANSELVYQISESTDTNIGIVHPTTRAHLSPSNIYSLAIPHTPIFLPFSNNRVQVLYDNTYDPAGSIVAVRSRLTKVTSVS